MELSSQHYFRNEFSIFVFLFDTENFCIFQISLLKSSLSISNLQILFSSIYSTLSIIFSNKITKWFYIWKLTQKTFCPIFWKFNAARLSKKCKKLKRQNQLKILTLNTHAHMQSGKNNFVNLKKFKQTADKKKLHVM